jgi:hypothetical protein
MTRTELSQLEALLKKYRAGHTMNISRKRSGHDRYRRRADDVLRDVRFLRQNEAFYRVEELKVSHGK